MEELRPTVVVTGISGNLGLRLLPQLAGFQVIGIDLNPPKTERPVQFVAMDLGKEESCRELFLLLRETRPVAVIHLAFVIDPVRTGILDIDQMWQVNVAGTARVMEAVTEANREDSIVEKFIFISSVAAYGSDLPEPVTEEFPLAGHTLPYAIHKMEADKVFQQRAPALRGCSAYMLRPHIFAGSSVENYISGSFSWHAQRAQRTRRENAEPGQASALHVALRQGVSGKAHSICPRGRCGAPDRSHLAENRPRVAAADRAKCRWTWRRVDL